MSKIETPVDEMPADRAMDERSSAQGAARYLAMLAHDLRTALGGVTGSLSLVDFDRLDADTRGKLERASESAQLLARILSRALDLAEFDAPEKPEPLDIVGVLRGQSRMWASEAAAKGIRFDVSLDLSAPEQIVADPIRLNRVLANVIGNAIKFTDAGQVTLSARGGADGSPVFEVTDAGPGLEDDMRARLFEPYSRPENALKPGTGLGLHIAHNLVTQMGGTIALDNRTGTRGCRAVITLPVSMVGGDTGAAAPEAAAPEAGDTGLPDLGGLRILMAEDNVTNQLVAGQMLRSMQAEVTVASDGAEAVEMFEAGTYDLMLVDIEMPRLSGLDVIRHVRSRPDERARMPLIALTAYAMREHREKIVAAGADGLIAKPILGIAEFGREILSLIGRDAPGAAPADPAPALPEDGGGLVDPAIYGALADTIGPDAMHELLTKVQEDLERVAEGVARGVAEGDAALVRARTHVLISVAGAIGATGLQSLAETLNAAAHRGDMAQMQALGARAVEDIGALTGFVAARRGD